MFFRRQLKGIPCLYIAFCNLDVCHHCLNNRITIKPLCILCVLNNGTVRIHTKDVHVSSNRLNTNRNKISLYLNIQTEIMCTLYFPLLF